MKKPYPVIQAEPIGDQSLLEIFDWLYGKYADNQVQRLHYMKKKEKIIDTKIIVKTPTKETTITPDIEIKQEPKPKL